MTISVELPLLDVPQWALYTTMAVIWYVYAVWFVRRRPDSWFPDPSDRFVMWLFSPFTIPYTIITYGILTPPKTQGKKP